MILVYVEWVDAQTKGISGWQDVAEAMEWAKQPLPIVRTCGLLVFASKDHIVVAESIADEEMSHCTKIPRAWIKTFERLVTTGPAEVESFEYPVPEGE